MMSIHYYLSIFPIEALIASELEPDAFGTYMAIGRHSGSSEALTFIEVTGELDPIFDVAYAKEKCESTDRKKNSIYLSVYRTLEHIPLSGMGNLHLVTRDGRSLALEPEVLTGTVPSTKPFYLFQEMCPIRPVVVTTLGPTQFCKYITSEESKIHVPRIAFADLRVIDLDNLEDSGNVGSFYHQNITHLKDCVLSVTSKAEKKAKTLDRTRVESFTYNLIDTGVYVGDQEKTLHYRMKSVKELRMDNYAWAKSALIL